MNKTIFFKQGLNFQEEISKFEKDIFDSRSKLF